MDWHWVRLTETSSTQLEAKRLFEHDPSKHRVVIAERQSSGRGRRGHRWESPQGGLWCTLIIPLQTAPDPFLNLLLGLSVQRGLSQHLPKWPPISLKWPNDLLLREKKWGGILSEVVVTGDSMAVLMGVGLNLQISSEELHSYSGVPPQATTILVEFGHSPSPEEALESILKEFELAIQEDRSPGGRERNQLSTAAILDTIGRRIKWVDSEGTSHFGEAIALTADGALEVEVDSASTSHIVELRSGEIHHLRNADTDTETAEES